MAKIILVSKKVNSTSWQLAQSLRSQQHEVVLLTSYGEIPPDTNGIEFMGYFKSWSLIEGIRIIPGLFGLQPQILHILLDEDRMSPAQVVLSTFAKSHPNCVLTTSLLDIRRGLSRRNPVRYLVEESDIVTCPSIETLGQLRGLNVKSTKQGRGILAPALSFAAAEKEMQTFDPEEAKILETLSSEDYVVIPFNETKFDPNQDSFQRIRAFAAKYKVALWGTYAHWSLRDRKRFDAWMGSLNFADKWFVTGPLAPVLSKRLLENSKALVLAGQKFTPVEMTEFYLRAMQSQTVLVLDSKQSSVHSDLWKNSINCWILDSRHLATDIARLLTRPDLRLPEALTEKLVEERHLVDSSMNELNRLYNRALNHLR